MSPAPEAPKSFVHRLFRLLESQSRVEEVNRLNALSDTELAKLGLEREFITRHVFRDRFAF